MPNADSDWLMIWLAELQSAHPDIERSVQAAHHLADRLRKTPALQQWLQAMGHDDVDRIDCDRCQTQLPDFLSAQQTPTAGDAPTSPRFAAVRVHLASCPFCAAAYAQIAEWLEASQTDSIPAADQYPHFDFPFLADNLMSTEVTAPSMWDLDGVQEALAAGRRWVEDAIGGVYVLLGTGLQTQPVAGWAVKSAEPGALLAQMILADNEIAGWELEVSAFAGAQADDLCTIEVAIYPLAGQDTVAGVPVSLRYDAVIQTAETDPGGVAQFTAVPIAALDQVVVHIALDSRWEAGQGPE